MPAFFEKGKYFTYLLMIFISIVIGTVIRYLIENQFILNDLNDSDFFIQKLFPNKDSVIFKLLIFVGALVFFIAVSTFIRMVERHLTFETSTKEILQQKTEAELKFLKNQINPHFLFNTLNNIYTLAYSKSDEAPDAIMSLSQMMRYVIYDTKNDKVLLEKEITFIRNYVALEKLRIEKTQYIELLFPEYTNSKTIAPMIFIPFVENCFKHGNINIDENSFIKIEIIVTNHNVTFTALNSVNQHNNRVFKDTGIGIENVKNRLNFIYNGKYELKTELKNSVFSVNLVISY
jgi:LytS/YehU family sensor histidine kinase